MSNQKPWETKAPANKEQEGLGAPVKQEGPGPSTTAVDDQHRQAPSEYEKQQAKTAEPDNANPSLVAGHDPGMLQMVAEWFGLVQQLDIIKKREMELRNAIYAHYFQNPVEGTNKVELPDGWRLDCQYKLSRKLDEAALPAILKKLPEGTEERVIRYKPDLNLREYRKLVDTQQAIFDEALIIKPSTPSLKLIEPKPEKN